MEKKQSVTKEEVIYDLLLSVFVISTDLPYACQAKPKMENLPHARRRRGSKATRSMDKRRLLKWSTAAVQVLFVH
jgi:hypothetical protein